MRAGLLKKLKHTFTNPSNPVHNSLVKHNESNMVKYTTSDFKCKERRRHIFKETFKTKTLCITISCATDQKPTASLWFHPVDFVTIFVSVNTLTYCLKSKLPETHPGHICMPLITNTWLYKWAPRKTALLLINTRGCVGRSKKMKHNPERPVWLIDVWYLCLAFLRHENTGQWFKILWLSIFSPTITKPWGKNFNYLHRSCMACTHLCFKLRTSTLTC